MLVARGSRSLRGATMRFALAFGNRVWLKVVSTERLRSFDTRYMPAAPGPEKPHVCLFLVLAGTWEWHGERQLSFASPLLVPMTNAQLEGANGRRKETFALKNNEAGKACGIEVHVAEAEVIDWPRIEPLPLSPLLFEPALRAAELTSDTEVGAALKALLQGLARSGLLRESFVAATEPSRPIEAIWGAVKPTLERFALSAKMDDLASTTTLSSPQLERALQRVFSTFGLVGAGIRTLTFHVRMKTAVYFLSSDEATVGEVAELVGYGSVDAMGRAFRDAGLPTAREIQRALGKS